MAVHLGDGYVAVPVSRPVTIASEGDAVDTLERQVVIVEGLDLTEVPPGRYELICLPLRLAGLGGAPARAVLIGS